jgi:hypothetical protein
MRRFSVPVVALVFVGFAAGYAVAQQPTTLVTLRITGWSQGVGNTIWLNLPSGSQVKVDRTDIVTSTTLTRTAPTTPSQERAQQQAGSDASVEGVIQQKCAADWPDNFTVRAFCVRTQREAVGKLAARRMDDSQEHTTIRAKCGQDWPNDFLTRNFCEETELKSLRELGGQ